ncbi:MAG TPA: class I SAM-dependent methyltransferase [Acidobacteriaceae bacterium]
MKFKPIAPLLLLRRLARSVEANGPRGAIAHSWQRLARSLRNHGIGGTFDRAFRKAPVAPRPATPLPPDPFDLTHGTDTGGYISGANFAAISLSALYTTAYHGTPSTAFTQSLEHLPIKPEDFTFIDLGCGKGRALMVAAQFSFRQLIGVELAPELCRIAESNIATRPDWSARISVLNHNATTFRYPDTPLLIFLYDPFLAPVLRRVLANLERQLRSAPRETWLLYANNPRFTHVLERFPFLREVSHLRYPLSPEDTAADVFHRTTSSSPSTQPTPRADALSPRNRTQMWFNRGERRVACCGKSLAFPDPNSKLNLRANGVSGLEPRASKLSVSAARLCSPPYSGSPRARPSLSCCLRPRVQQSCSHSPQPHSPR